MASKTAYDQFLAAVRAIVEPGNDVTEWSEIDIALSERSDLFVTLEEADSSERLLSVGTPSANWMEEFGNFDIHIFSPAQNGYDPIRVMAEGLRSGLRYRNLTPPDLRTLGAVAPVPGIIADGLWSSMIVSVEYRYMYLAPTAS